MHLWLREMLTDSSYRAIKSCVHEQDYSSLKRGWDNDLAFVEDDVMALAAPTNLLGVKTRFEDLL